MYTEYYLSAVTSHANDHHPDLICINVQLQGHYLYNPGSFMINFDILFKMT